MSLNIKDPEAHRLAQRIARALRRSILSSRSRRASVTTRVIVSPVARASVEELLAIADRAAAHVKGPYLDHAELLYDDHGLPK